MVSYWLPGVGLIKQPLRDFVSGAGQPPQPGPTSRASGDNVTGQIMSLGLRTVNASFLRVFPLLSKRRIWEVSEVEDSSRAPD